MTVTIAGARHVGTWNDKTWYFCNARCKDRFLAEHPEWHGRVALLALCVASRQEIPAYAEYLQEIRATAAGIDARFARDGWRPLDLRVGDTFPDTVAGYRNYDVLLVNAIADGMNLVAKEGPLLNARDGVLVLSRRAGAFEEIGRHAVPVDPLDVGGTADAIAVALSLPEGERRRRAAAIRDHVRDHDVHGWLAAQLADLDALGDVA